MYPLPVSAYRPQVQQPQFIPSMPHPTSQPTPPPPSSNYPYPPYTNHLSAVPPTTFTHPSQSSPFPQPMPYAMGGTTTGTAHSQTNNINGSFPVSTSMDKCNLL